MSKSKRERRSEELRQVICDWIQLNLNPNFEDSAANGGIIKDRLCYYLSQKLNISYRLLHGYCGIDNYIVDSVKDELKDLTYREVKDFYYRLEPHAKNVFSQVHNGLTGRGVIFFDRHTNRFLASDEWVENQCQAHVYSVINDDRLTTRLIYDKILGLPKVIMIEPKHVDKFEIGKIEC